MAFRKHYYVGLYFRDAGVRFGPEVGGDFLFDVGAVAVNAEFLDKIEHIFYEIFAQSLVAFKVRVSGKVSKIRFDCAVGIAHYKSRDLF